MMKKFTKTKNKNEAITAFQLGAGAAVSTIFIFVFNFALPNIVFCNDSASQNKIIEELTKTFRDDGWADLSFKTLETDTVSIHHEGMLQNDKLTEGELVSVFGTILTPEVVSKLKDSGFKKGVFVDGKSRKYPVEISRKYYDQLQAVFNRLSGGR